MTKNTPSGAKKHRESTEPESHQTAKMFFLLEYNHLILVLRTMNINTHYNVGSYYTPKTHHNNITMS